MRLYAAGTFTGKYQPTAEWATPDIVSLHEFGVLLGGRPGRVMYALARVAVAMRDGSGNSLPIVGTPVAQAAVEAVSDGKFSIAAEHLVDRNSTDFSGRGTGTRGELQKLREVMDAEGKRLPVLVGQAHHIGRIALQAEEALIGDYMVSPDLPTDFEPGSAQPWTRGLASWAMREFVGVPMLHLTGQF